MHGHEYAQGRAAGWQEAQQFFVEAVTNSDASLGEIVIKCLERVDYYTKEAA